MNRNFWNTQNERLSPQMDFHGHLLAAHPILKDPNFAQSVVFLANHSDHEGAIGVVLNRPLKKTLSQIRGEYTYSPLANVPVFWGGPVDSSQLLLAAWEWSPVLKIFKLFFGISPTDAEAMLTSSDHVQVCCFTGISGWSKGQLEAEIDQSAWLKLPISENVVQNFGKADDLWQNLIASVHPELFLLAFKPKNLQSN